MLAVVTIGKMPICGRAIEATINLLGAIAAESAWFCALIDGAICGREEIDLHVVEDSRLISDFIQSMASG